MGVRIGKMYSLAWSLCEQPVGEGRGVTDWNKREDCPHDGFSSIQNPSLVERDFDQQSNVQNVHLLRPPQAEEEHSFDALAAFFPP